MSEVIRRRLHLPPKGPARVYGDNKDRLEPVPGGYRREKPVRRKEGHDALIQTLAGRGATVEMEMMDSEDIIEGTLLQSDRFTVSIRENDDAQPLLIFKHAIRTMRFVVPGLDAEEAA